MIKNGRIMNELLVIHNGEYTTEDKNISTMLRKDCRDIKKVKDGFEVLTKLKETNIDVKLFYKKIVILANEREQQIYLPVNENDVEFIYVDINNMLYVYTKSSDGFNVSGNKLVASKNIVPGISIINKSLIPYINK